MRIAHVVEAAAGGVLTYMRHVLPSLVAGGCSISLIWSRLRGDANLDAVAAELRRGGVTVFDLPMLRQVRPGSDLRALWRLAARLKANGYDLVHTHASKAGVLGRLAARLAGLPAVHTPHCFSFLRQTGRNRAKYLAIERLMGRFCCDRLAAVSAGEMRTAVDSRVIPASRCVVVNNGLPRAAGAQRDASEARRLLGLPEDSLIVSMAARLVPEKGVMEFIEAACRSGSKGIFVIAGDGPLASAARDEVTRRDLHRRVILLGNVARMEALHAASDIAVLLSRAEGQPYSLLEAMQAGRAVVAADVPGLRGLIEHGRTGLLVDCRSRPAHEAIDRLLADADLRRRLGRAAQDHVSRHHRLEDQVAGLIAVYADCLRGKGRKRLQSTGPY